MAQLLHPWAAMVVQGGWVERAVLRWLWCRTVIDLSLSRFVFFYKKNAGLLVVRYFGVLYRLTLHPF